MFVKNDYRDRAIGLVAAFAVLAVGINLTDALAAPRTPEPAQSALIAQHAKEMRASDCSLARRSEESVPVC